MGLFSRKSKTSIDELCQQFYDYYIFGNTEFYDNTFKFITQGEATQSVDMSLYQRELSALRIEIFGLALWNYNYELSSSDNYKNKQSLLIEEVFNEIQFTKRYLEVNKNLDIWEAMAFYNEEIAQAKEEKPFVRLSGLVPFARIAGNEESQRKVRLTFEEATRDTFYEPFKRLTTDSECLTRLMNRAASSSQDEWSQGFISQRLSRRFAERLGYIKDLNWEGMFRLQALIFGMYNGTQNYIETLPFLHEQQERLQRLLKAMKKVARNRGDDEAES